VCVVRVEWRVEWRVVRVVGLCVCGASLNVDGCIAQSVERWSNKPLVKGSSPFVTTFVLVFFVVVGVGVYVAGRTCTPPQRRIRGRAVKALRSGRSPL
jgi:ABC-type enterobactin transport system permease subunit